jgi:hypothetical protein
VNCLECLRFFFVLILVLFSLFCSLVSSSFYYLFLFPDVRSNLPCIMGTREKPRVTDSANVINAFLVLLFSSIAHTFFVIGIIMIYQDSHRVKTV